MKKTPLYIALLSTPLCFQEVQNNPYSQNFFQYPVPQQWGPQNMPQGMPQNTSQNMPQNMPGYPKNPQFYQQWGQQPQMYPMQPWPQAQVPQQQQPWNPPYGQTPFQQQPMGPQPQMQPGNSAQIQPQQSQQPQQPQHFQQNLETKMNKYWPIHDITEPFSAVINTFQQQIQKNVEEKQPSPEEQEDALWFKLFNQILQKASPVEVGQTLSAYQKLLTKYKASDPFKAFSNFLTNANPKGVSRAENAVYGPQNPETQSSQGNYISLLEACVFTKNVQLFETLVDRLIENSSAHAQDVLNILKMAPISATGHVPTARDADFAEGVREICAQQKFTYINSEFGSPITYDVSNTYQTLIHYIFENQCVDFISVLLKIINKTSSPDANLRNIIIPILHQSLVFHTCFKCEIREDFWKAIKEKLLPGVFEYEIRFYKNIGGTDTLMDTTPLIFLCAESGNFNALKRFVLAGAPFLQKFSYGRTPGYFVEFFVKNAEKQRETEASGWNMAPQKEEENAGLLGLGTWLFGWLNKSHFKNENAADLFLVTLDHLAASERTVLLKNLTNSAFLGYFTSMLAKAQSSIVTRFVKAVAPDALIPWLESVDLKTMETFFGKCPDVYLQQLVHTLIGKPKAQERSSKNLPLERLEIFWKMPNATLQAKIFALLMGLKVLDNAALESIVPKMSPQTVLCFLEKHFAKTASRDTSQASLPTKEDVIKFVEGVSAPDVSVQFCLPLLTKRLLSIDETEALLLALKVGNIEAILQALFDKETQGIPDTFLDLLKNSRNPTTPVRLFEAVNNLRILENPGDLLSVLSPEMLKHVLTLWLQKDSSGKSAPPIRTQTRVGTQTPSNRTVVSRNALGPKASSNAVSIDGDRLNILLNIREADFLAQIVSLLIEQKLIAVNELSYVFEQIQPDALPVVLKENFDKKTHPMAREVLMRFFESCPLDSFRPIWSTLIRLNAERSDPTSHDFLDIQDIEALLMHRPDKDLEALVDALFEQTPPESFPECLEMVLTGSSNAAFLARLMTAMTVLVEDCSAIWALLPSGMLPKVLGAWFRVSNEANNKRPAVSVGYGVRRSASVPSMSARTTYSPSNRDNGRTPELAALTPQQRQTYLSVLLKIQDVSLLARIMTILMELKVLATPKDIGDVLTNLTDACLDAFLTLHLSHNTRTSLSEPLREFVAQAPTIALSTRLLETILRLRLLDAREFEVILTPLSDDKFQALFKTLFSANETEIPSIVYELFNQSNNPLFTVRLLNTIACLKVLDGENLGNLLYPLSDERLRRVLETMLGVASQNGGMRRMAERSGASSGTTNYLNLLSQLKSPELIIRFLGFLNEDLLPRLSQPVLSGFVTLCCAQRNNTTFVDPLFRVLQLLIQKSKDGEDLFTMILKIIQNNATPVVRSQLFTMTNNLSQTLLQNAIAVRNAGAVRVLLDLSRPKGGQATIENCRQYLQNIQEAYRNDILDENTYQSEMRRIEEIVKPLLRKQLELRRVPKKEQEERVQEEWASFINMAL